MKNFVYNFIYNLLGIPQPVTDNVDLPNELIKANHALLCDSLKLKSKKKRKYYKSYK